MKSAAPVQTTTNLPLPPVFKQSVNSTFLARFVHESKLRQTRGFNFCYNCSHIAGWSGFGIVMMKSFSEHHRLWMSLLLAALFAGCYPSAKIPMGAIHYDAINVQGPRSLIVFLPGRDDSISVFKKEGLIEAVRERGLPIDMVAVDAHIGYYMNWSILVRLKEDVIEPLKPKGYSQIWLVGDSLGAYGAISYAKEHQNEITGVVLMGPFLGEKQLLDEIKQSGGLNKWDPGDIKSSTREAWERSLWAWFKDCQTKKGNCPRMYLGYGHGDRFSYAQDYLASYMSADHVIAIDGNHNWRTWKKIWHMLLDNNVFQGDKIMPSLSHEVKP